MTACGAQTRPGHPCRRPAGPNGRCRLHDLEEVCVHLDSSKTEGRSLTDEKVRQRAQR